MYSPSSRLGGVAPRRSRCDGVILARALIPALVLLLLTAPEAEARRFNIVLSAGESGNFNSASQTGCSREHPENCNLYKVVYNTKSTGFHNTGYASSTRKLTNYAGSWAALFPAVDPGGRYVVFDRQEIVASSAPTNVLRILDMDASSPTHQLLVSNGRFPHYYSDGSGLDSIVYSNTATGDVNKLTFYGPSTTSRLATALWFWGVHVSCPASAAAGGNRVYSDPHIDPTNPDVIVFTDKDDLGNPSGTPAITSYVKNTSTGATFMVVDSTVNTTNLAHPAFNMSGDEIVTGSLAHDPYGFRYDGGTKTWVSSRAAPQTQARMFATYSAADLAKYVTHQTARTSGTGYGQALLDPLAYPEWGSFRVLNSYVQFCQDDDWVVVSVQGARTDAADGNADSKSSTEAEYSRAFLVDITDREDPIYYDLILPLEGNNPYSMEGHGATCYPLADESD